MSLTPDPALKLADGCVAEHDPAINPTCVQAPAPDPVDTTALPDMTDAIIRDMVEGVARYSAIAADAEAQARQYRQAAAGQDESVVEYRGKAESLGNVLRRLGYNPATGEKIPATVTA